MISRLRRWRIILGNWEYWPWQVVYAPLFVYWILLSIRSGSLLYFSAVNPRLRNGGMLGVSKHDILSMIPATHRPGSCLIPFRAPEEEILEKMQEHGLGFPLIAKPDVGERGFMVRKVYSMEQLQSYARQLGHSYILQEFVDLPLEAGIFYYRMPGEPGGNVSSVVLKKMLTVTGDGRRTLSALIRDNDRAFLQWDKLKVTYKAQWDKIPKLNEEIELVSIGNHCLGTTFLDGNRLISPGLIETMDKLADKIQDFHYGRFDVRAADAQALEQGRFQVLELNGANAEPAHIYHPGSSFWTGQRTLFRHWQIMFRISEANHRLKRIRYPGLPAVWNEYRRFRALKTLKH